MSKDEMAKLIAAKQNEHDQAKKKWDALNAADNPYTSGNDRADKGTLLGHLSKTIKDLKSEIVELERKADDA